MIEFIDALLSVFKRDEGAVRGIDYLRTIYRWDRWKRGKEEPRDEVSRQYREGSEDWKRCKAADVKWEEAVKLASVTAEERGRDRSEELSNVRKKAEVERQAAERVRHEELRRIQEAEMNEEKKEWREMGLVRRERREEEWEIVMKVGVCLLVAGAVWLWWVCGA